MADFSAFYRSRHEIAPFSLFLFNCESAEYEFNISNFVHLKKSK